MKCPKCQTENRDGAEFCRECGQSLQPDIVYPQCSHASPQGSKFCDKCGHPLAEPTPAPTAEAPPPSPEPTSFGDDRYQIKKLLGEGYRAVFGHVAPQMQFMAGELAAGRPPANIMIAGARQDADLQRRLAMAKRNDPCPCGSGRKFKHCHG